jgi:hypothetical protein
MTSLKTKAYTYSELTKTQKEAIDTFIKLDPSLESADSISRTRLEVLYAQAVALNKEQGKKKFGYPSFLTRTPKVGRARYPWPGPNSKPFVQSPDLSKVVTTKDDEFEQEFMQEMKESGII